VLRRKWPVLWHRLQVLLHRPFGLWLGQLVPWYRPCVQRKVDQVLPHGRWVLWHWPQVHWKVRHMLRKGWQMPQEQPHFLLHLRQMRMHMPKNVWTFCPRAGHGTQRFSALGMVLQEFRRMGCNTLPGVLRFTGLEGALTTPTLETGLFVRTGVQTRGNNPDHSIPS
jgi:hypothetical protein